MEEAGAEAEAEVLEAEEEVAETTGQKGEADAQLRGKGYKP